MKNNSEDKFTKKFLKLFKKNNSDSESDVDVEIDKKEIKGLEGANLLIPYRFI